MQVDVPRKRIGLSMRLTDEPDNVGDGQNQAERAIPSKSRKDKSKGLARNKPSPTEGSLAAKLKAAGWKN
jgi:uncharacterized protein